MTKKYTNKRLYVDSNYFLTNRTWFSMDMFLCWDRTDMARQKGEKGKSPELIFKQINLLFFLRCAHLRFSFYEVALIL